MDGSRADVIGKTCGQCKKRVTGLSSHPLAKVSGSHVPGKKLAFSVVAAAVRTVFAVVPFTVPAGPVGMFLTLGRFGHAFGPRQQGLARKTEFARLLVHRQQLDINLVAFLQQAFQRIDAFPVVLGNMQQAVLAGQNLHKGAEFQDGLDGAVIDFAFLGLLDDGVDELHG